MMIEKRIPIYLVSVGYIRVSVDKSNNRGDNLQEVFMTLHEPEISLGGLVVGGKD